MKIFKTNSVAIAAFQSHLNNWEIEKLKDWERERPSECWEGYWQNDRYCIQPSYTRQISKPKSQTKPSERMLKTSRDPFHYASAPPLVEDNAKLFVPSPSFGSDRFEIGNQKVLNWISSNGSALDLPPSYSEAMGLTSSDLEFPDYGKISANRWYRSIY